MDRVVLGAGPVGLVAAYVLEADACVGSEVGGSDLRRFAPTFLWRTEATEQLLADLDLHYEGRTVRFGYLGDDGPKPDFDEAERLEYFRRSRGLDPGAPVEVPDSAMSSGMRGEIPTFDLSVDDLVRALLGRVEVTRGVVTVVEFEDRADGGRRIPRVRVALRGGAELRARRVVNTIPAPAFDALCRYEGGSFRKTPRTWGAGPKTFLRLPLELCGPVLNEAAAEFAFVYVVSSDRLRFPYDRVNFPPPGEAVLEFNLEDPAELPGELERFSARLQIEGAVRDPVEFGGAVWHVGRLARWSHAVRIHDVVEELYDAT
jgi:hypothetical protein